MAPLNPDSYRDNEKHVDNFADHLRQTAARDKKDIVDIAAEEAHRFRDVMFGVNTEHDGAQLRLRDNYGKVITKLKEGAQLKIIGEKLAQTIDNDRNKGAPDDHIWVEIETDAAATEKGGTGKVRGWVSTEYIQSLSEPIEPVPLDPVLDNPDSWGDDIPEPPKPREPNAAVPDVTEPEPREPNAAVPDVTEPEPRGPNAAVPDVTEPEPRGPNAAVPDVTEPEPRGPNAAVPDGPANKPEGAKDTVPDGPKPEKEKGKQEEGKSAGWLENIKNWFLSWGGVEKKSETTVETVEPKAPEVTAPTTKSENTKKDIPVAD